MTWIPAVQAGASGQKKLVEFAKVVLQAYRHSKNIATNDEEAIRDQLTNDKSIMAHILCNSYPSEEHRLSDVIVFLVAGSFSTHSTPLVSHMLACCRSCCLQPSFNVCYICFHAVRVVR
jgi:hypothetical protein